MNDVLIHGLHRRWTKGLEEEVKEREIRKDKDRDGHTMIHRCEQVKGER